MRMHMKFLLMITTVTVFLLLIFSHIDRRQDRYAAEGKQAGSRGSKGREAKVDREPNRRRLSTAELTADYTPVDRKSTLKSKPTSADLAADYTPVDKKRTVKTKPTVRSGEESRSDLQTKEDAALSKDKLASSSDSGTRSSSNKPSAESEKKASAETIIKAPEKATYPSWFSESWSLSPARSGGETFVGDQPLFEKCKHGKKSFKGVPFIEPKDYIPESKNPCWFEDPQRKRGFRCIPYFYIAGVAKCGTTDLYRRLRLHPDIMKGTMKEYHFWDRERFGNVEISESGDVTAVRRKPWTFDQYTNLITGNADLNRVLNEVKFEGHSHKLFGDGSPSYLWDILHWERLEGNQGCKEPRIVIGQHIRHIYPPSKMILIFRHPTPRLYSRFLSRIWRTSFLKTATSTTFHNYVVNGVKMYYDCFKRHSIRQCAYNYTIYDEAVIRLVEGMYPVFMADWLRIWPREQMLLLRSEDYGVDLERTVQKTFDFLDVAKLNGSDLEIVVEHQMVNVGSEYQKLGPMLPETVKILDEFYQPFVDKFAEILQDSRFLWKDVYPPKTE